MNDWTVLVSDYMRAHRRRGSLSCTSQTTYRSVLSRLALGLGGVSTNAPPDEVLEAVEDWIDRCSWSPTTRCTNLGIIRPFLEWGAARQRCAGGVASRLKNPRRPKPLPRALRSGQVATLLTHVPDPRGAVIVLLESQCGLRRAEVASVRWPGDVDLAGGAILVRGKGGIERMVYPSAETAEAIRHLLGERGTASGALICPLDGKSTRHLSPTWVGILVGKWMTDAGIKSAPRDGIAGHALRHTAATQMLRDGANVKVVQEGLGHANLSTTARYLRADNDEVRAAMSAVAYGARRLRAVPETG